MAYDFSHITDWELRAGSHKFPGPDGGTCVNEAAIIAAGMKYKPVQSIKSLPPCFCPVIGGYTIRLNDHMPHAVRQALLPFVVLLAGTRAAPMHQRQRTMRLIEFAEQFPTTVGHSSMEGQITHAAYSWATELCTRTEGLKKGVTAEPLRRLFRAWARGKHETWDVSLTFLREMINIGGTPEAIDAPLVADRLKAAKRPKLEPVN